MWMCLIVRNFNIFKSKIENRLNVWVELQCWEGKWSTSQLGLHLLKMVHVQMCITDGVDKFTRHQFRNMCDHMCEKRITRNIKRNTEEGIAATLIELAGQFSLHNVKLEQTMTRR